MKMYDVYIGLGSNIGDRAAALNAAVKAISALPETRMIDASPIYETDPVGGVEQPLFLNAAVGVETSLTPPLLVSSLKAIEESMGRQHRERWGPREIDCDILIYDGVVYKDETVEVPHPMMHDRRFVLVPLREIAPDLVHPISGLKVTDLADACREKGSVKRTSFRIHW
jgi:2-amino-4-hydroxy-6-hydroxymethyldihydropteridine diphosphokinase